ncbi:ER protein Pkr1-domain-containing protein [Aspergillus ambiguus]|uniref:V-type ATPase assembly factor PKR1 n=1 Tax=Aspergillus ambiguus TaxID=176160 RepID=UPI003CCE4593
MASFVEDLWSSIFTPGPTPTLLIATNVTFAALQVLLLALLLATYSIHFVVLSVLSASLWWAINWFAAEVRRAQEAEKAKTATDGGGGDPQPGESAESDTETEGVTRRENILGPTSTPAASAALQPPGRQGEVRKRTSMSGDNSSGYGSTDSEWEKVDEQ